MRGELSLNGTWDLLYEENDPDYFTTAVLAGRPMLQAAVPAPVHKVLQGAGLIDDPNIGMNSLKARWVEEMFWIYRRTFTAPSEVLNANSWLVFQWLELNATVYLNGEEIGTHANAHRPARFLVTGKLHAGENLIVLKLESGLHADADSPGAEYGVEWFAKMTKRPFHRKAQYQAGWDWSPRMMNVGILGDVRLEWQDMPRLDEVTVFAVPSADLTSATFHARASIENLSDGPVEVALRARIEETGQEQTLTLSVPPGETRHEITLAVENPRLWWPIGHGDQALYTVAVSAEAGGEPQSATRRTGVRSIEMDQSPHPVEGRYCRLKINNRLVFCKGGNWVPPDLSPSAVTPERYRELVDLAVHANFNLLRVWGGGIFADHVLCDACDEAGILLWHDFLFACAKYPGDLPAFAAEVRGEVTHAVRKLAHHPSLAVWCGNNEIEWGDWGWGYDTWKRTHPHYALFHHDIPKIVFEEDPSTLHWISSPWSPDFQHPNNPLVGDQHPWEVSLGEAGGADFWNYRGYVDRFPNEGGVLGMSSPATLLRFLPEKERYIFSPSWRHHDNSFALLDSVRGNLGHAYQTVSLWTGRKPEELDWKEYAFVSALLQAEGLTEYILNYRRRMFSSGSAIFWMFNDSWPVTHGWTIVDYYMRKKLAFHPVRRAFQPVTVVAAREQIGAGDGVTFTLINDSQQDWSGTLRYGAFDMRGAKIVSDVTRMICRANSTATYVGGIDFSLLEMRGLERTGALATLIDEAGNVVAQYRVLFKRFHELDLDRDPQIDINLADGVLTLKSVVFVWGVCLDVDGEIPLPDNCFDLLPGVPYRLPWSDGLGEPRIVRTGNHDALRRP